MFCRKCGKKIPEDSVYCPICGAEIEIQSLHLSDDVDDSNQNETVFMPMVNEDNARSEEKNISTVNPLNKISNANSKKILVFVGVAVILITILGVWLYSSGLKNVTIDGNSSKLTVASPVYLADAKLNHVGPGIKKYTYKRGSSDRFVFEVSCLELYKYVSPRDLKDISKTMAAGFKKDRSGFTADKFDDIKINNKDGIKILGTLSVNGIQHRIKCVNFNCFNEIWTIYIEYDPSDNTAEEESEKIINSIKIIPVEKKGNS